MYLNRFCREVQNVSNHHLSHDQTDSDKTVHLQLATALDEMLKDRSGALNSPFSLFHTIKAPTGKRTILGDFFQPNWKDRHRPQIRVRT